MKLSKFLITLIVFIAALIIYYFIFNNDFASNNDLETKVLTHGDYRCLDKKLTVEELSNLNKEQLSLLKNTIYAKYGYIFKTKEYQVHFSKFKWYKPQSDEIEQMLTDTDWDNLNLILILEDRLNITEDSSELIGIWHKSPVMLAGWSEHYHFFRDGRFRLDYTQMIGDRNINMSGKWETEKDKLILFVMEKTIIEGGTPADVGSTIEFDGGVVKNIPIIPPQRIEKKILQLENEVFNEVERKVLTLDGEKYWYYGGPFDHIRY